MLRSIQAKNFKSWADTGNIRLAPLTGLFGTNSSGKTSLLQILLMLKQTVESPDRKRVLDLGGYNSIVDLGTFRDLIFKHAIENTIELTLNWDLRIPLRIIDIFRRRATLRRLEDLSFYSKIKEIDGIIAVEKFMYFGQDLKFGMEKIYDGSQAGKYDLISDNFSVKRVPGRVWKLPSPIKLYGFPDEVNAYYQNVIFLSDCVLRFEELFNSIKYLGPLREYPRRNYLWSGEDPGDVGRRGEQTISALLASRKQRKLIPMGYKKKRRTIDDRIGYWLEQMNLIHSYRLEPLAKGRRDYELRIKTRLNSPEVLITDVGFGVSQILPILVLCYYAPEGSIIILEQPEIHLHPFVQSILADVFIEVVNNRNVQIIVESHSEHLLRRLQRRIAEENIKSENIALYFCRNEKEGSSIDKLEVDIFGNILNWPEDFFGDELGELSAMTIAAQRRKTNNDTKASD